MGDICCAGAVSFVADRVVGSPKLPNTRYRCCTSYLLRRTSRGSQISNSAQTVRWGGEGFGFFRSVELVLLSATR